MSDLLLKFDREGITPRIADELDEILASIQTWANRGVMDRKSYASFVQPRCRYFLASNQAITTGTDTSITWDADLGKEYPEDDLVLSAVHYDNGDQFGHDFLRADGDFLAPPVSGQYLVIAGASFEGNATGRRDLWLQQRGIDGATFDLAVVNMPTNIAANATHLQISAVMTVRDPARSGFEDAVRVMVFQNSGGNLNAESGFSGTYIQMIKVS